MQQEDMPSLKDIEKEFEFASVHYGFHLLHGLEIIGYKHPDPEVRAQASLYYVGLTKEVLHLEPESEDAMDNRLKDID